MSEQTNNPYYIFIICGDVPMMIGKTGQYVRKFKNALAFTKKIDALEYVDRHGYNRIATVRQIKKYTWFTGSQMTACNFFYRIGICVNRKNVI